MNKSDCVPNSRKYKEEVERKIEKVAKGRVNSKKKHNRFTDVFIAEDASNVKSYVFSEVLIPAAKKLIWDIVSDGTSMILFGETGRAKKRPGAAKVSYRDYYDDPRDTRRYNYEPRTRRGFDYDDIAFDTKGEAELVLDRMCEVIEAYGFVTVADLYDLADLTAPAHTCNKYGWTSLRNAETVRTRDGYVLKLPRASVID